VTVGRAGALVAPAAPRTRSAVAVVDGARRRRAGAATTSTWSSWPGASGAWRASGRPSRRRRGAVESMAWRAPAFRPASDRPIRPDGREYPSPLEIVRSGDGLAVVSSSDNAMEVASGK